MTRTARSGVARPAPAEPARRRPWRTVLLTVHVAAAVGLVGADLVLVALGVSGARGADPRTIYPAASIVESWVTLPLVVIALGTGVAQALVGSWGLVRYWWTTVKLVLTGGFTLLVVFLLVPRLADSAAAAQAGAAFTAAQRLPLALVPAVAVAALVLNVVLGLTKPPARLLPRRAR